MTARNENAITNIGNIRLDTVYRSVAPDPSFVPETGMLPEVGALSFPKIADAPSADRFISKMKTRIRLNKTIRSPKDNGNENEKKATTESFVPKKPPLTESESRREDQRRDRVWAYEYMIELGLILFGFALVPLIYYCLVQKAPVEPRTYTVGSSTIDHWLQHIIAPSKYFDYWTDKASVSPYVTYPMDKYPATFILFGSLVAVVMILLNKNNLVQTIKNMANLKASSLTHMAIAWSWYTKTFAFTLANVPNLMGWLINFFGSLLGLILLIIFSHMSAVVAQGGLMLVVLYVFLGIEKWRTTGEFRVTIPDPYAVLDPKNTKMGDPPPPPVPGGNLFEPSDLVPKDCDVPAVLFNIWEKINQSSFSVNRYTTEIVLILFGVVKTVKSNMRTKGGKIGAYGVNGLLISGALASILFKSSAVRDNLVPVHVA